MNQKYYNDAIIGNKNIRATFSKKGELLRLYYPSVDFKQFIDFYRVGVKINDSGIIYLHEDINNRYNQYYTENTNILNTEIENTYFNLQIKQTDFVSIKTKSAFLPTSIDPTILSNPKTLAPPIVAISTISSDGRSVLSLLNNLCIFPT